MMLFLRKVSLPIGPLRSLWRVPFAALSSSSPFSNPNVALTTNKDARAARVAVFLREKQRQLAHASQRIEKIQICVEEQDGNETSLLMNRNLSTPLDCARHIRQLLCDRSVVALVDGKPWDMHRPLETDCRVAYVQFKDTENPEPANLAFWRSCSMLLGGVIETALKPEVRVELCSFPPPLPSSGSFVYDLRVLPFADTHKDWFWEPNGSELRALSTLAQKMAFEDLAFETLLVDPEVALEMFAANPIKTAQIPAMVARSESITGSSQLRVYRAGDQVELSAGPMMSRTGLIGRFAVTAVRPIDTLDYGRLVRVQGVALPVDFLSHFTTFEVLMRRAAKYNTAPIPKLKVPPRLEEGQHADQSI